MMTCRELIDFIMEYLDGELPQEQRSVFEEHLKLCPPCLEYLESYKETVRLGKECLTCEDDAPLPDGVPDRLLEAIRKARREG